MSFVDDFFARALTGSGGSEQAPPSEKKSHKKHKKHKKKSHDDHHRRHRHHRRSSSDSGSDDSHDRHRSKKHKKKGSKKQRHKHKHHKKEGKRHRERRGSGSASPRRRSASPSKKAKARHGTADAASAGAPQRDSWMTASASDQGDMFSRLGKDVKTSSQLRAERQERERQERLVSAASRELNEESRLTVLKSVGDDVVRDVLSRTDGPTPLATASSSPATRAPVVGDGGASWRRSAMRNARRRAEEDGVAVADVLRSHGQEDALRHAGGRSRGGYRGSDRGGQHDRRRRHHEDHRRSNDRDSERYAFAGQRKSSSSSDSSRSRTSASSALDRRGSGSWRRAGSGPLEGKERRRDASHETRQSPQQRSQQPTPPQREAHSQTQHQQQRSPPSNAKPAPNASPAPPPSSGISESDPNKLTAMAMKAQLMGNTKRYEQVQARLREIQQGGGGSSSGGAGGAVEVVNLPKVDPLTGKQLFRRSLSGADRGAQPPKRGSRHKGPVTVEDGQRVRFFADDDSTSLSDLVQQERVEGGRDYNRNYARAILRSTKRYKGPNADPDDDDDTDLRMYERRSNPEAERQRAIQVFERGQQALDRCHLCYRGKGARRDLVVALGNHAYVTLPAHEPMHPLHCQIVPVEHAVSSIAMDEDVWAEVQRFQASLVRLCASYDVVPIFVETVMRLKQHRHTFIDCIPLPTEEAMDAPLWVHKALTEADGNWSQHRKTIDTTKKGIRHSVPAGFAYIHFDFPAADDMPQAGVAHVIEKEAKFPTWFGRQVVAGIVDLPPSKWRKPKLQPPRKRTERYKHFLKVYQPYDWTAELE